MAPEQQQTFWAVEHAVRGGWATSEIMRIYGAQYPEVQAVRELLARPASRDGTHLINGRPEASYFGPADPAVIDALVDEVCPRQPRRRGRFAK